jgi:6-pyruvoyltetrahydropterin/6-carboxytetrahydropterin synthase
MYEIGKQFDFCYGHRVWSQELNPAFSLDSCLSCRHLHGHQGKLIVYLKGAKLQSGMVTDFKHLNWFKKWVDDVLDHKMIVDINDPANEYLYSWLYDKIGTTLPEVRINFSKLYEHKHGYWIVNPVFIKTLPKPLQEIAEGLVFVRFVPTSENLSKWIFSVVQNNMSKLGVNVSRVQFFETPKSESNYYE